MRINLTVIVRLVQVLLRQVGSVLLQETDVGRSPSI